MTDHYELLGVQPDATKDEIRSAYRSEIETADSVRRAELNRAWNVLSDPMQRQRYDATLARGAGDVDDEDDESSVPARKLTGARRGAEVEVVDDGPGRNGSDGRSGDKPAGNRRVPPPPTIELPEGLVMADAKTRSLAMVFDLAVLLAIFILVVPVLGGQLIKSRYPKQSDRIDAINKQLDKNDTAKKKADDAKSKADDQLSAAKKNGSSTDVSDAQDAVDRAEAKVKGAAATDKRLNDELTKLQDEFRPITLLLFGVVIVLALAYTVPMSALTGQTLGKRLRKIRLVRVDGSEPGWGASLIHYGVPIVATIALFGVLQVLALLFGLGMVLWNIRDRNRQGVPDKLAKTFVVDV